MAAIMAFVHLTDPLKNSLVNQKYRYLQSLG